MPMVAFRILLPEVQVVLVLESEYCLPTCGQTRCKVLFNLMKATQEVLTFPNGH